MDVLITGGSGFLGAGLARHLLAQRPGQRIILTDIVEHPRLASLKGRVEFVLADITDPGACRELVRADVGAVYHFASLVSGGAERDFAAGLKANVLATIHLLEACRQGGGRPRFVFTSSIATFGGRSLPREVDDLTHQHPQNSYGVAKVIGEQLVSDYSRKGFLDGRAVRLPAIVVRDEPNTAASGYASALIREPLHGRDYVCPVGPETRIPILSVRRCVQALARLGEAPAELLGDWRALNAPSLSPSAVEVAEAVKNYGLGAGFRVGRITFQPDPQVQGMVGAWPRSMRSPRAAELGLVADASIEQLIADYARELPGGPT